MNLNLAPFGTGHDFRGLPPTCQFARRSRNSRGQPEIPADFGTAGNQPILNISESEPELSATLMGC